MGLEWSCPPCAERAKMLRVIQCREGWHLEDEPAPGPAMPDQTQEYWLTLRAEAQVQRDRARARGEDVTDYDALLGELDAEITRAGVRGTVTTSGKDGKAKARRVRSTRHRQDAPELPRRKITPQTIAKVFNAPDGKSYRPSMFLTLTCASYGKVRDDGTPADPDPARYTWHVVTPDDPDHLPYDRRLLYVVAERTHLTAALDEARRRAEEAAGVSAIGRVA